jgi:hypothetical protein
MLTDEHSVRTYPDDLQIYLPQNIADMTVCRDAEGTEYLVGVGANEAVFSVELAG